MTSTKKKGGLGAESYFENIPILSPVSTPIPPPETDGAEKPEDDTPVSAAQIEEVPEVEQKIAENDDETPDSEEPDEPPAREKIRRTYALYEETQIALEEMKLAARKQGMKMTLGDLLEEAVQLLMEKRGMAPQETTSQ